MLASHNSYTFLPAINPLYNILSKFWKCQNKDIKEQYLAGVRYFDMRVCRKDNLWYLCHGLAIVDECFDSLYSISKYFKTEYPEAQLRIILEKGKEEEFIEESKNLRLFKNIVFIGIKKNWDILYQSKNHPKIVDLCFKKWSLKNIFTNSIKKYSEERPVSKDMINQINVVYFKDFV